MATTRTRPAPPDLDAEAEVDLGRYGHALLARWWLLLVGLVVGAIIGYLSTLGGAQTYRAQAVTYMGQPLGSGQSQVQALNTNPSSARTIVTSGAGRAPGRAEGGHDARASFAVGTSVTAVRDSTPKLDQTPLIAVTVKGPEPARRRARPTHLRAACCVSALSGVSAPKIKVFEQQIARGQHRASRSSTRRSRIRPLDDRQDPSPGPSPGLPGRSDARRRSCSSAGEERRGAAHRHARRRRRRRRRAATATPPPSAR